jgi:hypothetical protein
MVAIVLATAGSLFDDAGRRFAHRPAFGDGVF